MSMYAIIEFLRHTNDTIQMDFICFASHHLEVIKDLYKKSNWALNE